MPGLMCNIEMSLIFEKDLFDYDRYFSHSQCLTGRYALYLSSRTIEFDALTKVNGSPLNCKGYFAP